MNRKIPAFFLSSCILFGSFPAVVPAAFAANTDISSDIITTEPVSATVFSLHASQTWMEVGEQQQLTAAAQSDSDSFGITWDSSDDSICSVDENGTVTAISDGCAEITGTLDSFSAKLLIHVGLSKPEITSISLTSNGTIALSWSSVPDCDGYRVYHRTSNAQPWEACETLTTLQWTEEKTYTGGEYSVRAFKLRNSQTDDPLTLWSAYAPAASTAVPALSAPTQFSAEPDSADAVALHWACAAQADGYFIYRKAQKEDAWTLLADITDSTQDSYFDTTAAAGHTYFYAIRSYQLINEEHKLSAFDSDGISCRIPCAGRTEQSAKPAEKRNTVPASDHIYAQYTTVCTRNAHTTADIMVACKSIDGTVIPAGKSFSFDTASKTSDAQHSISGNIFGQISAPNPTVSSGFCEVSSALQQLAKRGSLFVTLPTGSTPKQKACAPASTSIQLTNTTDQPLRLKAVFRSGTLRLQLLNMQ